jgi:single-stranded-DNA-specific exonuclease
VGLVAGRLAEEFYRPTIVLSKDAETATGSARTIGNFSIINALKHASVHIDRFGGHQQAAGLTISNSKFEVFYQSVLTYAEANLEVGSKILELDIELLTQDINLETYKIISALEPFGVGNSKPKFLIKNAVLKSIKLVGSEGKHAQAVFGVGNNSINAIGFNMSKLFQNFSLNTALDVACELLADTWNNQTKLKLRILDIKKTSV